MTSTEQIQSSSRRRLSFGAETQADKQVSCCLCNGNRQNLTSPSQWKNVDARRYIAKLNVSKGGLVCPACRKDITRVLANSSHIPRWTKLRPGRECCVQECSKNVFASLHKTTSDEVRQIFDSGGLKFNSSTIPVPVPLYKHHYHLVYSLMQPRQEHCVTCGTSLRRDSNPKPCPQPALIEHYLKENTGYEGYIKESDKVCYVCYRSHCHSSTKK